MAPSSKNVIMIAIAAVVISVIIPMGLVLLGEAGSTVVYYPNGTAMGTLSSEGDANLLTLLTVILPLVVVIGILMAFIPKYRK